MHMYNIVVFQTKQGHPSHLAKGSFPKIGTQASLYEQQVGFCKELAKECVNASETLGTYLTISCGQL